jgi:hypothetical protein
MNPHDMSKRAITLSEQSLITTVNDIRLGKANATTKRRFAGSSWEY